MSDEPAECPLCMEVLEIDDHSFFPCTCGYQICRFCWHRIRTDENGLCPACRKQYPEDPAEFKPLTEDELQNIKKERKQKDVQRKQKAAENRKHLANVRVVQRNLVFVVGLSPRLADPEVLKKHEYFGKFGKIHKVVINQSTSYAGSQGPSASAYVTYVKPEDALRAILTVNNIHVDGRTLKTSLGTTKYCSHFLKGSHCQKNDCMYLHELGEEAASFTKDEMQAGKHQEYEQMLIEQFLNAQNSTNNHHVITNNKLKKNVSQQNAESTDVIPSLMDMAGDIKHNGPAHPGPLLPNPGSTTVTSNGVSSGSHSAWPLLENSSSAAPGNGITRDKPDPPLVNSSNRAQNGKSSHRSNTPPGSGGGSITTASSNPVGTGRQKASSSTTSSEDINLISSQASSVSSSTLSSSPEQLDSIEVPQASSTSLLQQPPSQLEQMSTTAARGLPLPTPVTPTIASPRAGSSMPTNPLASSALNSLPPQQTLLPQEPLSEHNATNSMVSAIGSNRRLLMSSEPSNNHHPGLSFFSNGSSNNGVINACNSTVNSDSINPTPELPSLSLSPQELSDTLPITSDTDWSAAFGFKSKDISQDDDLGFDPCAESFKGLADLMEKENGLLMENGSFQAHLQNGPHSPQQSGLHGSPTHSSSFLPLHNMPTSPIQTNTQPPSMSRLPPGFSMSHIQQQQQLQQLYRPDLANSKMIDYLNPHFGQAASHPRYSSLNNYHSMPLDLHTQHQQQSQQLPQRDVYNMKDMQDQLRSMLPNINISFGGNMPQQQSQQQQLSSSLHVPQQSQVLNKSWPLPASPETSSPWNDPAIVSTSQLSDHAETPHWLKSLQQLTETDGPSSHSRLPFAQQFPVAGSGGWPPHTHNPPPGFRINGMPTQQNPESSHQMAEVLQ